MNPDMVARPRLGQALSQINHPGGEFQKALFKIVVPLNFLSFMQCANLKPNLDVGCSMFDFLKISCVRPLVPVSLN